MMTEYLILGGVLIVMGAVQMWLRWGSWAKQQQEADQALAKRRAEAAKVSADEEESEDGSPEGGPTGGQVLTTAGSKLWTKWTAILGPLGMALGVFLVIWGIIGE